MLAKNEKEVVYLFSRNHEKLGFEKIIKFNTTTTPDCIAIKDGKKVGIEFEYKLKKFLIHYEARRFPSSNFFKHKISKGQLIIFRKDNPRLIEAKFSVKDYEIWDPSLHNIYFGNLKGNPLIVKFRSLAKSIPYVICWEKDCVLNDDIQIIELKNMKLH